MCDISRIIDRITNDIQMQKDNAIAIEFTKRISELLRQNGVMVNVTEYNDFIHCPTSISHKYGVFIKELDFSEHDKVFEDKIAKLEKKNKDLESCFTQREQDSTDMIMELKQRISELESKETEKPTKLNLNDQVKVKLTPLGAEIYYNRYDFLKSSIRAIGGVCAEPKMPKIDEDGYTEMTMWQFIELYGKDIGKINREVINPLDIIIAE